MEVPAFHHVARLRVDGSGEPFGSRQEIHVLELPRLNLADPSRDPPALLRWARFLLAEEEGEIEDLANEDETMKDAAQKYQALTQSTEFISLARRHQDALWWQERSKVVGEEKAKAKGREEGREEGRIEGEERGHAAGRADAVLDVLAERFGRVGDDVRERVLRGTEEELTSWLRAALWVEEPARIFDRST
jgi:flagellar biosynthesis/type III secretory pathway protein FliH